MGKKTSTARFVAIGLEIPFIANFILESIMVNKVLYAYSRIWSTSSVHLSNREDVMSSQGRFILKTIKILPSLLCHALELKNGESNKPVMVQLGWLQLGV